MKYIYSLLPTCTVLAIAAGCGAVAGDASASESVYWQSRTQPARLAEPQSGDLTLEIENRLPAVSVPEPRIPTVSHLNVKICSVPSDQAKARRSEANKNRREQAKEGTVVEIEGLEGRSNCLDLSPSAYWNETTKFVVPAAELLTLLDGDYQALQVLFHSSRQWTTAYWPCSNAWSRIDLQPGQHNVHSLSVVSENSVIFTCQGR